MVQYFKPALVIHTFPSIGVDVAILDAYEDGVSAEIIAVEDELDVWSGDMGERRWARVVLLAESGPEMPSRKTRGLFDAVSWLVVEVVECDFDAVWRITALSNRG